LICLSVVMEIPSFGFRVAAGRGISDGGGA
jgi:hypothetical protein